MEDKARVRTPEGARKYGQPIGSLISRDAPLPSVRPAVDKADPDYAIDRAYREAAIGPWGQPDQAGRWKDKVSKDIAADILADPEARAWMDRDLRHEISNNVRNTFPRHFQPLLGTDDPPTYDHVWWATVTAALEGRPPQIPPAPPEWGTLNFFDDTEMSHVRTWVRERGIAKAWADAGKPDLSTDEARGAFLDRLTGPGGPLRAAYVNRFGRHKYRYAVDASPPDPNEDLLAEHTYWWSSDLLGAWAQSMTTEGSTMISMAVQELFPGSVRSQHAPYAGAPHPATVRRYQKQAPPYRAAARGMHDRTQKWLASKGITEVTLYRGIHDIVPGYQVRQNTLDCWSSNRSIAVDFSQEYGGAGVHLTRFPADRILCVPMTGLGCLTEREFVVIGREGEELVPQYPESVKAALLRLQEKAVVRTAAGARKYGQPIGSTIVADPTRAARATMRKLPPPPSMMPNWKVPSEASRNLRWGKTNADTERELRKLLPGVIFDFPPDLSHRRLTVAAATLEKQHREFPGAFDNLRAFQITNAQPPDVGPNTEGDTSMGIAAGQRRIGFAIRLHMEATTRGALQATVAGLTRKDGPPWTVAQEVRRRRASAWPQVGSMEEAYDVAFEQATSYPEIIDTYMAQVLTHELMHLTSQHAILAEYAHRPKGGTQILASPEHVAFLTAGHGTPLDGLPVTGQYATTGEQERIAEGLTALAFGLGMPPSGDVTPEAWSAWQWTRHWTDKTRSWDSLWPIIGTKDTSKQVKGLDLLEAKVRHVRTPEGARKYGQPIGSVIGVDVPVPKEKPTARPKAPSAAVQLLGTPQPANTKLLLRVLAQQIGLKGPARDKFADQGVDPYVAKGSLHFSSSSWLAIARLAEHAPKNATDIEPVTDLPQAVAAAKDLAERMDRYAADHPDMNRRDRALAAFADVYGEAEEASLRKLAGPAMPVLQRRAEEAARLPVVVRMDPWTMAKALFEGEGRVRTQFETGTSNGFFGPDLRRVLEASNGVPWHTDPEDRPVYGYLRRPSYDDEGVGVPDDVDHYGSYGLRLKDEAKARTTFQGGDTLDQPLARPSPMTAPSGISMVFDTFGDPDLLALGNNPDPWTYLETQTVGGVWADDVAAVGLPPADGGVGELRPFEEGPDGRPVIDQAALAVTASLSLLLEKMPGTLVVVNGEPMLRRYGYEDVLIALEPVDGRSGHWEHHSVVARDPYGSLDKDAWVFLDSEDRVAAAFDVTGIDSEEKTARHRMLLALEAKVRHVRTPEGVRKYGLPIGSPIVARPLTKPIRPLLRGGLEVTDTENLTDQFADRWHTEGLLVTKRSGSLTDKGELKHAVTMSVAQDILADPKAKESLDRWWRGQVRELLGRRFLGSYRAAQDDPKYAEKLRTNPFDINDPASWGRTLAEMPPDYWSPSNDGFVYDEALHRTWVQIGRPDLTQPDGRIALGDAIVAPGSPFRAAQSHWAQEIRQRGIGGQMRPSPTYLPTAQALARKPPGPGEDRSWWMSYQDSPLPNDPWWDEDSDADLATAYAWSQVAVHTWAQSSDTTASRAWMIAAQKITGRTSGTSRTHSEEVGWARQEGRRVLPEDMRDPLGTDARTLYKVQGPMFDAAARGVYDRTQAMFRRWGMKDIPLYRGVGNVKGSVYENRLMRQNALSAWSWDSQMANVFSRGSTGGYHADPAVLGAMVPVDRIFCTPLTGLGCWDEQEVVVVGGRDPVTLMLVEHTKSLDEVETKVRHVRTPEGARKFGQPIGSVITPGPVDPRKAAQGAIEARKLFTRQRKTTAGKDPAKFFKAKVAGRVADGFLADPECRAVLEASVRKQIRRDALEVMSDPKVLARWQGEGELADRVLKPSGGLGPLWPERVAVLRTWDEAGRPDPDGSEAMWSAMEEAALRPGSTWNRLASRTDQVGSAWEGWWEPKEGDLPDGLIRSEATYQASSVVHGWAESSDSPRSKALMMAAKARFDLHGTVRTPPGSEYFLGANKVTEPDLYNGPDKPLYDSAVDTMYSDTQEMLAALGVTELVLFRGVGNIPGATTGYTQQVTSNLLSSWTHDRGIADRFAYEMHTGGAHADPAVLVATVPVERIFSSPLTGLGCLAEKEWVLMGDVDTVMIG